MFVNMNLYKCIFCCPQYLIAHMIIYIMSFKYKKIYNPPDNPTARHSVNSDIKRLARFLGLRSICKKGFVSYFCSYLYLCCCCFLSQGHPCPWEGGHQQHKHFRKTSSRLSTNMYIGVHVYTSCECDTHTHKLS